MMFTQNIADFKEIITQKESQLEDAFQKIKSRHQSQGIAFLDAVFDDETLETARKKAQDIKSKTKIKNLVLLGTGGSALGTRAVANWKGHFFKSQLDDDYMRFFVFDNFDPLTLHDFLSKSELDETYFIIISKSGGTLETMSQAYLLVEYFEQQGKIAELKERCTIVTEPKDTPLKRLADKYDITSYDHHLEIGGRYSVLTMTGFLPIYLLGYDVAEIVEGARDIANEFLNAKSWSDCQAFHSAAAITAMEMDHDKEAHISLMYGDRYFGLGLWMRQLIAESLGKDGKGMVFAPALGPVDQHSQLQLYADGPKNKVFSFFMTQTAYRKNEITREHDPAFSYLKDKTTSDIKDALQFGTLSSLRNKGYLVREISVPHFALKILGGLFMHFMLETIISAELMGVNAFDQPAVEDSKNRTRNILKK
ncbi:MAG: hypothetical protein AAF621_02320 [Pseudomonadota bacterium]